jgi:hypothetical protein
MFGQKIGRYVTIEAHGLEAQQPAFMDHLTNARDCPSKVV